LVDYPAVAGRAARPLPAGLASPQTRWPACWPPGRRADLPRRRALLGWRPVLLQPRRPRPAGPQTLWHRPGPELRASQGQAVSVRAASAGPGDGYPRGARWPANARASLLRHSAIKVAAKGVPPAHSPGVTPTRRSGVSIGRDGGRRPLAATLVAECYRRMLFIN